MNTFVKLCTLCAVLFFSSFVRAAQPFVGFETGGTLLNQNGKVTIFVDTNCEKGVVRAANDLCSICLAPVTASA